MHPAVQSLGRSPCKSVGASLSILEERTRLKYDISTRQRLARDIVQKALHGRGFRVTDTVSVRITGFSSNAFLRRL